MTDLARTRAALIAAEIRAHPQWCSPRCQTFVPQAYELARLRGQTAKSVQDDYDACHAVR